LAGIEKRWEDMPPQEQAELWMLLRDRMKVDWHEMTLQEKKIGMYPLSYAGSRLLSCCLHMNNHTYAVYHFWRIETGIDGASIATRSTPNLHMSCGANIGLPNLAWWISFGPHGPRAQTPPGEWGRVFLYSGYGIIISLVLFFVIHGFARPPPRTMTKEWQEATNEYLKVKIYFRY
jgi:cytochrome c oxidase subunit 4